MDEQINLINPFCKYTHLFTQYEQVGELSAAITTETEYTCLHTYTCSCTDLGTKAACTGHRYKHTKTDGCTNMSRNNNSTVTVLVLTTMLITPRSSWQRKCEVLRCEEKERKDTHKHRQTHSPQVVCSSQ